MTRTITLRPWQRAALEAFAAGPGSDFLAVATPGAGKTTFALTAAGQVLAAASPDDSRRRLIVVVPTAHLALDEDGLAEPEEDETLTIPLPRFPSAPTWARRGRPRAARSGSTRSTCARPIRTRPGTSPGTRG